MIVSRRLGTRNSPRGAVGRGTKRGSDATPPKADVRCRKRGRRDGPRADIPCGSRPKAMNVVPVQEPTSSGRTLTKVPEAVNMSAAEGQPVECVHSAAEEVIPDLNILQRSIPRCAC